MIQLYTGNGKGKTTASLGLAFRALGHHWKVLVIQWLKLGEEYGEVQMARTLPNLTIEQYGSGQFIMGEPKPSDFERSNKALARAMAAFKEGYQLVILDEFLGALGLGLVTREQAEALLEACPPSVELVLTGRGAPEWLIEKADLVSEVREIKHPYTQGVPAREGIEY